MYVADRENHRIQVFDSNGRFETQWVNLARAACVSVSHRGEPLVYVGEFFAGIETNQIGMRIGPRVTILDTKGNVMAHLSDQTFGAEPGRFYSPHGIAADSKGNIYVAEVSKSENYGGLFDNSGEIRTLQKLVKRDGG